MDKPLPLAFQKALHGDARRARYHAGDIIRRNALAEHSTVIVHLCGDLALEIGNCGVAQARRGLVITLALCNLKLMLGLFETGLALFVALQPLALCPYIRYDCSCSSHSGRVTCQLAIVPRARRPPSEFVPGLALGPHAVQR